MPTAIMSPIPILLVGEISSALLDLLAGEPVMVHAVEAAAEAIAILAAGLRPGLVVVAGALARVSVLLQALDTAALGSVPVAILSDLDEPSEDPASGVFVLGTSDATGLLRVIQEHVKRP
jgi:hypothetical protein